MAKQNKKQTVESVPTPQQESTTVETSTPAPVTVETVPTPQSEPAPAPVTVETQVSGRKRKTTANVVPETVQGTVQGTAVQGSSVQGSSVPSSVPEPVEVQQKKKVAKKTPVESTPVEPAQASPDASVDVQQVKRQRGRRKTQTQTQEGDATPNDTVVEPDVDAKGRHLRSFKVKLPGSELYEGRFTGLTPYQAANKALSKFFRNAPVEQAGDEVTFSICESTRNSRKAVYTYIGARVRLEVPVEYSIEGGRVIVKNFKNSLRKVKKVQQVVEETPVAPVA